MREPEVQTGPELVDETDKGVLLEAVDAISGEELSVIRRRIPGNRTPCAHCGGSGVEQTVLEQWDAVGMALAMLDWPQDRIAAFLMTIQPDETLSVVRALSVDLVAGRETRTFFRYPKKDEVA